MGDKTKVWNLKIKLHTFFQTLGTLTDTLINKKGSRPNSTTNAVLTRYFQHPCYDANLMLAIMLHYVGGFHWALPMAADRPTTQRYHQHHHHHHHRGSTDKAKDSIMETSGLGPTGRGASRVFIQFLVYSLRLNPLNVSPFPNSTSHHHPGPSKKQNNNII